MQEVWNILFVPFAVEKADFFWTTPDCADDIMLWHWQRSCEVASGMTA